MSALSSAPVSNASGGAPDAVIRRCMANDRFGAAAGIELVAVAPGHARARMTVTDRHRNGLNLAHGGAIFTLADFAFAAAVNAHGQVAVAIQVSISFLKAVTDGTLWAEAREVSANPRLAAYTVEVKDESGELVALFQGMAYRKNQPLPGLAPGPQPPSP